MFISFRLESNTTMLMLGFAFSETKHLRWRVNLFSSVRWLSTAAGPLAALMHEPVKFAAVALFKQVWTVQVEVFATLFGLVVAASIGITVTVVT
jgi:hypothetical protein